MEELIMCPIDESYKIAESTIMIREAFNYVVTKRQLDLIYAIISLINKDDDIFKTYEISFKEIAKIYNPQNPRTKEVKKYVDEATNKIMDSHFQITEGKIVKKYHWVEYCEINHEKEIVTFKLSEKVRKFYLQLKENNYTIYLLKDLLALSTLFQANVFRWLSCNSNFENGVKINIEVAKQKFYGGKIETGAFIRKLNSALDTIRRKTNIDASYIPIKKGKTIVQLKFFIDNNYQKDFTSTQKSPEQYVKDAQRKKAMWKENLEMKRKIAELEKKLAEKEVTNTNGN